MSMNKNYTESTYFAVSVVLGFKRDMSVWLFPEGVESLFVVADSAVRRLPMQEVECCILEARVFDNFN